VDFFLLFFLSLFSFVFFHFPVSSSLSLSLSLSLSISSPLSQLVFWAAKARLLAKA